MYTKLELTWVGKGDPIRIEPRILIEDAGKSNTAHDPTTPNMLIHGDNLIALKSLERNFTGEVKCIYIDPPYNTGSAFEHYDDSVEHSLWLSLMRARLDILRKLLRDDGSIWISIDCDEGHYLKVLCDEVFGRRNFIDEVVWQRSYAPINLKKTLSRSHDLILVYAKNKTQNFELNKLPRTAEANARYKNPDNDPRGAWQSDNLSVGPRVESNVYEITTPSGRKVIPPEGRSWVLSKDRFNEYVKDNRIWFGEDGNNTPRIKRFLSETKQGIVAMTWWTRDEVGDSQEAKRETKAINSDSVFATPKQERLLQRIITLATNPGDLVLDSFLGSGTTAAVAHKMGRRWIGIELGDHCYTHCKPRLDKVIADEDQGGITKSAGWNGGGGYKFYELAPTLINKDFRAMPVISDKYSPEMLAIAIALHEGYAYDPDPEIFWRQSKGSERSWLYVTTNHVDAVIVDAIFADLPEDGHVTIACLSYDSGLDRLYRGITIKKIPQMLLSKCEFGKDNYNLNIISPPDYEDEDDEDAGTDIEDNMDIEDNKQ